jgi:hypothetical protein
MSWPNNTSTVAGSRFTTVSGTAVPTGIPSSGTIGDNGALTLTTAFPRIFAEGIYLYFPAGAISAGSAAGLYWTVMSSTTAGVIYANTHTSGDTVIPASPTPIVATGPGAYTQVLTEVILRQNNIIAGSMGVNGSLRTTVKFLYVQNANSKTISIKLGGVPLWSRIRTGGSMDVGMLHLMNAGRVDRQIELTALQQGASPYTAASVGATLNTYSINLAVDQIFVISAQLAVATDYVIVPGNFLEVQQ